MLAIQHDTFDPVLLSIPENHFVREHVGKAPAVIARIPFPPDVNPRAVMPVFEQAYALGEIEKADGAGWCGSDAIRAGIDHYLAYLDEAATLKAQNRHDKEYPRWPSMAAWDKRGRYAEGAVGTDSHRVRTYFDEHGDRQPLAVPLHPRNMPSARPRWIKAGQVYEALIVDEDKGSVQCPICNHAETYQAASQSSKNLAFARMAKHLAAAKTQPDEHRELAGKVKDAPR